LKLYVVRISLMLIRGPATAEAVSGLQLAALMPLVPNVVDQTLIPDYAAAWPPESEGP
jgi:hypothetical protein